MFKSINDENEFKPTRDNILSLVKEEDIFERYGLTFVEIGNVVNPERKDDNNPSVSFFVHNSGRIWFYDHGSTFWRGDCFNFVEKKFNLSHSEALIKISEDFGLFDSNIVKKKFNLSIKKPKKKEFQINTEYKVLVNNKFSDKSLNWWKQFHIKEKTLDKFNVYEVQELWFRNHKTNFNWKQYYQKKNYNDNMCFGYLLGEHNNIKIWKFYFPNYKIYFTNKFITNKNSTYQGVQQLRKSEDNKVVLITKSLKEVMSFYEFGIPSIAMPSESIVINNNIINMLYFDYKFNYVFSNFDNDSSGKKQAIINMNKTNLYPLIFKDGKDFTDINKNLTYNETYDYLQSNLISFIVENVNSPKVSSFLSDSIEYIKLENITYGR